MSYAICNSSPWEKDAAKMSPSFGMSDVGGSSPEMLDLAVVVRIRAEGSLNILLLHEGHEQEQGLDLVTGTW